MIDKVIMITTYICMAIVVLLLLPYYLYLAWKRIIALIRQLRGLDFDLRASK